MNDLSNAILITNSEYAKLENPIFEGQTKVDKDLNYKMYWSVNGTVYYTINNLMS